MNRYSTLLGAALLAAGCSSTNNPGGGTADSGAATIGLDGTWDLTFTNAVDPDGPIFKGGTVEINGRTAKLTIIYVREGTNTNNCNVTTARQELNFALGADGSSATSDATALTQADGTGCPGTAGTLLRLPESNITFARSVSLASSFGNIGGQWKVTADTDVCDVKIEGTTFIGKCAAPTNPTDPLIFPGNLSGSINGNTMSGKLDGGGEFAAKRR